MFHTYSGYPDLKLISPMPHMASNLQDHIMMNDFVLNFQKCQLSLAPLVFLPLGAAAAAAAGVGVGGVHA